jgi:hypothetical protein
MGHLDSDKKKESEMSHIHKWICNARAERERVGEDVLKLPEGKVQSARWKREREGEREKCTGFERVWMFLCVVLKDVGNSVKTADLGRISDDKESPRCLLIRVFFCSMSWGGIVLFLCDDAV